MVIAVVSFVAGVAAVSSFIVGFTVAAWFCALIGLFVGIAGVRRVPRTAPGLALSIGGIVICSITLLVLVAMLALFLTRPFRY